MFSLSNRPRSSSVDNIGLSAAQLHKVYPYHIAIDDNLRVCQLGEKLAKLVRPSIKLNGVPIQSLFEITSPICQWDLNELEELETCTFELQLKNNSMFDCKTALSLKGGIVVAPQADGKRTVLFLLSLNFSDYADLQQGGFDLTDISRYTFQEELFTLSKL